jgi:hypothetical protein
VITVPTAITRTPRLCRWVAVMALALGVVVMHHVLDTHAHGGLANGSASMMMPASQIQDCCAAPPGAVVAAAVHPVRPGPEGALMLHPCLAVVTGLVLLAGLVAARRLTDCPHTHLPTAAVGKDPVRQRGPPIPLRLAQLGVLRL